MKDMKTTISDLPTELIIHIIGALPWRNLRRIRLVCRLWNIIALKATASSALYRQYPHNKKDVCPEITYTIYVGGRYYGRLYVMLPTPLSTLDETVKQRALHRHLLGPGRMEDLPLRGKDSKPAERVKFCREGALPDDTNLKDPMKYLEDVLREPQSGVRIDSDYNDYKRDPMMLLDGIPQAIKFEESFQLCYTLVGVDHVMWTFNGGMKTAPISMYDYIRNAGMFSVQSKSEPYALRTDDYDSRHERRMPKYITVEDFDLSMIHWAFRRARATMLSFARGKEPEVPSYRSMHLYPGTQTKLPKPP